jgi:hypothetical protein
LTPYYWLDAPFVARRSLRARDTKSASVAHYSLSALETVDFWAWFTHLFAREIRRGTQNFGGESEAASY